jgi:hypothetical protein
MKICNKILVLLILFTLAFTLTACQVEQTGQDQQVIKPEDIPEYVLVQERLIDSDGKVYGTVDYDYNEYGQITEVIYKNETGEVIEHKKYRYNDKGLLVERKVLKVVEDWNKYSWRGGTYDLKELNKKRVVHENMYLNKGTSSYQYNDKNQLVYFEEKNEEGKKVRWMRFKYHSNGNIKSIYTEHASGYKEEYYFDEDGKWIKRIKNEYHGKKIETAKRDKYGNVTETTEKNEEGEVTDKAFFKNEYKDGTLRKSIVEDDYGSFIFEYDEDGNKTKYIQKSRSGMILDWEEYKYNDKGKQVLRIVKNEDGKIIGKYKTIWEYDKNDNIIKGQGINLLKEDAKNSWKEYQYKKLN